MASNPGTGRAASRYLATLLVQRLVGVALYLVAGLFTVWPVAADEHFEATSRIQDDRGQHVVTSGPYRIVRHPGYLGIVLWAAATGLMFANPPVCLAAAAVVALVVTRTYLEDRMLTAELDGYADYARQVGRRLIPGVW